MKSVIFTVVFLCFLSCASGGREGAVRESGMKVTDISMVRYMRDVSDDDITAAAADDLDARWKNRKLKLLAGDAEGGEAVPVLEAASTRAVIPHLYADKRGLLFCVVIRYGGSRYAAYRYIKEMEYDPKTFKARRAEITGVYFIDAGRKKIEKGEGDQ